MGTEIERKFLVNGDAWRQGAEGELLRQGYLSNDPTCTVRVRIVGKRAFLTIKGQGRGLVRPEFEYPIPVTDAESLLGTLCRGPLLEKTRFKVQVDAHVWEVDEFHGANQGLIVAEIELGAEDEAFTKPAWVGQEVSDDPRYLNARLVSEPFSTWK